MATWILLILMIDGGVDHIEMNSQQSCIEAREQIKNNNMFYAYTHTLCIKK